MEDRNYTNGKNAKKQIALFDLDGTLTAPRKTASVEMLEYLRALRKRVTIGIVSGSDLQKIDEQLGDKAFNYFDYVFPENGVVAYKNAHQISAQSISAYLKEEKLKKLINFILMYFAKLDIPIKRGTFIEYRTGMLNISPIGRNCSYEERLDFQKYDEQNFVRKNLIEELKKNFKDFNLHFSVGGQISVDVFPLGWDKSFCLQFLDKEFAEIHFFGDKTDVGGNDYEIFEDKRTIGHHVDNPADTIRLLNQIFSVKG